MHNQKYVMEEDLGRRWFIEMTMHAYMFDPNHA